MMQAEGAKKVEIIAKDDKRQITVVIAGSLKGDTLPLQIIYQGKTPRCLPSVKFPTDTSHLMRTIGLTKIQCMIK